MILFEPLLGFNGVKVIPFERSLMMVSAVIFCYCSHFKKNDGLIQCCSLQILSDLRQSMKV